MTTGRPRAVTEISLVLLLEAACFAPPGIAYLVQLIIYTGYPPTLFCVGALLFLPSLALAIVAIQFYRLQRWTYPIVRALVGTWWQSNTGLRLGFPKKIKSAEVRQAFGLPPIPDEIARAKIEERG